MRLITSKISRSLNNSMSLPLKCNFIDYLPDSLNCICDCKYKCKFPDKGGTSEMSNKYINFDNEYQINYNSPTYYKYIKN